MKKNKLPGLKRDFEDRNTLVSPQTDEIEKYREELAEMSLSHEQETEILRILWAMMSYFARMGQTVDVCGLFFSDGKQTSDDEAGRGIIKPSIQETPSKRSDKEAT